MFVLLLSKKHKYNLLYALVLNMTTFDAVISYCDCKHDTISFVGIAGKPDKTALNIPFDASGCEKKFIFDVEVAR